MYKMFIRWSQGFQICNRLLIKLLTRLLQIRLGVLCSLLLLLKPAFPVVVQVAADCAMEQAKLATAFVIGAMGHVLVQNAAALVLAKELSDEIFGSVLGSFFSLQ